MVTADGVVRQCNPQRNPGLFWACRGGGGGNFGVATRFTFTTHPASTATIFRAGWSWSEAARVVDAWQRWAPNAPDELFSLLSLEATDSGGTRVGSSGQFFGTSSQLQALLAPFFAAGATPVTVDLRTLPYLDAMLLWAGCSEALHCTLGDGVGRSTFAAKSDYVTTPLSSAGIDRLLRAIEARAAAPARASVLLDAYGGVINRVPKGATAFVHRDALFSSQYIAGWDPPAGGPAASALLLAPEHARGHRPHVSGQAYQNYIDADFHAGPRLLRVELCGLRRVKRRYDPKNVFRFAQSIVPAPGLIACSLRHDRPLGSSPRRDSNAACRALRRMVRPGARVCATFAPQSATAEGGSERPRAARHRADVQRRTRHDAPPNAELGFTERRRSRTDRAWGSTPHRFLKS